MAIVNELDLNHLYSGKVRDLYEVDDEHLLMVASDRMSAFDVVMHEPIPAQGTSAHRPHRLLGARVRRRRYRRRWSRATPR